MIAERPQTNGFWAIEVERAGRYQITLRERPAVAQFALPPGSARLKVGDVAAGEGHRARRDGRARSTWTSSPARRGSKARSSRPPAPSAGRITWRCGMWKDRGRRSFPPAPRAISTSDRRRCSPCRDTRRLVSHRRTSHRVKVPAVRSPEETASYTGFSVRFSV